MWHRVEKRGRAGMGGHWIWMTLFIYLFDRTDDALSKTNLNDDTLTAGDWEGGCGNATNKLKRAPDQETRRGPPANRKLPTVQVSRTSIAEILQIILQS